MEPKPLPTSFRLSAEARRLLRRLSEKLALNRTAVIETAIRAMAESKKVK